MIMKKSKKISAAVLAAAMAAVLVVSGDGTSAYVYASSESSSSSDDMITITFYNTKGEIADRLDEAAERYAEEFGVNIEISYPSDNIVDYIETTYSVGTPYTIAMVESHQIQTLGPEHAVDMSGCDWVDDTSYEYSKDGCVYGFPFCVEGMGIIYNADAIQKTTGEKFDPDSIIYLGDFIEFLNKLVDEGMEYPTVIQKLPWSLSHHYLQQVIEERTAVDSFIIQLYAGKVDLISDSKFNALMDTFDVLMEYNYFWESPAKASDETVFQTFADGSTAFKFGGNWEWDNYIADGSSENLGLMPLPQDIEDYYTDCIVGGVTKYLYIDNSEYTTDEQREAALDFLDWLVYSDEGQELISDTCGLVSPFDNNEVPCSNPLSETVREYEISGKLIPLYNDIPEDYISIIGAIMQDYLSGTINREQLAMYFEEYWVSATPVDY